RWLRAGRRAPQRVTVGTHPATLGRRRRGGLLYVTLATGVRVHLHRRRQDGLPWMGDPAFDRMLVPEGPDPRSVRAILDAPVRELAMTLMGVGVHRLGFGPRGLSFDLDLADLRPEPMADAVRDLVDTLPAASFDVNARLLRVALEDPEVRVKSGAAEALLAGGEDVAPDAVRALAESAAVRPWLRIDALWALERWPRAAEVWRGLVRDPCSEVAVHALERIGERRGEVARADVLAALDDPRDAVAAAAVRALGGLLTDEVEVRARLDDGRTEVRRAAVEAAAAHAVTPETAQRLGELMRSDGGREFRRQVARALERMRGRLPPSGALGLVPFEASTGTLSLTADIHDPGLKDTES
ncbi:MAG: hypothetical protein AAFU79_31430, partial [Myxococcota bacterium]